MTKRSRKSFLADTWRGVAIFRGSSGTRRKPRVRHRRPPRERIPISRWEIKQRAAALLFQLSPRIERRRIEEERPAILSELITSVDLFLSSPYQIYHSYEHSLRNRPQKTALSLSFLVFSFFFSSARVFCEHRRTEMLNSARQFGRFDCSIGRSFLDALHPLAK